MIQDPKTFKVGIGTFEQEQIIAQKNTALSKSIVGLLLILGILWFIRKM